MVDMKAETLLDRSVEDLTPEEAKAAILHVSKEAGAHAEELYEALSAWTWSAVRNRRADPELVEWLRLFKTAQAALAGLKKEQLSYRISALADLIYRSVRTDQKATENDLLGKKHVKNILRIIHEVGGRAPRKMVLDRTSMNQANLTRVTTLMESAGLLIRQQYGREIDFELTDRGESLCEPTRNLKRSQSQIRKTSGNSSVDAERGASGRIKYHPPEELIIFDLKERVAQVLFESSTYEKAETSSFIKTFYPSNENRARFPDLSVAGEPC